MEKLVRALVFFSFILLFSFTMDAQQYFVLESSKSLKNHKYKIGDDIVVITKAGGFTLSGTLSQMTDSSIFIDNFTEIKIHNIQAVVRTRQFIGMMSGLFFIRGGVAYLAIVGVNSTIHSETPIIDKQTAIVSASMIATGFALKPLIHRKCDVDKGWHIKILDFDRINQPEQFPF